jgi:hypothetical protein
VEWWRVRAAVNAVNGSTLLGLAVATLGQARIARGPEGLLLATGFSFGLPRASAFTLGDVVLTRHDDRWWDDRARLLSHEGRHAWQYAMCLGLPMLPLYAVAAGWSYVRGGDVAVHNVFERGAGLEDGGYPLLSRRQRLRLQRAA